MSLTGATVTLGESSGALPEAAVRCPNSGCSLEPSRPLRPPPVPLDLAARIILDNLQQSMLDQIEASRMACYRYLFDGQLPTASEISAIIGRTSTGLWELMDPTLLAGVEATGSSVDCVRERSEIVLERTHFKFSTRLWINSNINMRAELLEDIKELRRDVAALALTAPHTIKTYLSLARIYVNCNPFRARKVQFPLPAGLEPRRCSPVTNRLVSCMRRVRANRPEDGALHPMPLDQFIRGYALDDLATPIARRRIYFRVYDARTLRLMDTRIAETELSGPPPGLAAWSGVVDWGDVWSGLDPIGGTLATAWHLDGRVLVARAFDPQCPIAPGVYAAIDAYAYCYDFFPAAHRSPGGSAIYQGCAPMTTIAPSWGLERPVNYSREAVGGASRSLRSPARV
jgi:hypothetical protein